MAAVLIILLSLCKLAYQASLSCAKLKRILALGRGVVGKIIGSFSNDDGNDKENVTWKLTPA